MLGLDAGALAVHFLVRVGVVELDMLDIGAGGQVDLALARSFQLLEDLILDLQVPGIVVFAGLQHRPRGRYRIAAALHLHGVEERLVGDVVVRIDLAGHQVARVERLELERPCAHRFQVGRSVARLAAAVLPEQVLGNDHAVEADEGIRPERCRLGEDHLDGMVVDLLDLDVDIAAGGDRGGRGILAVFPVEHEIVGRERLAVVELHSLLDLPGHRGAIGRQAAVLNGRDLGGQHRH